MKTTTLAYNGIPEDKIYLDDWKSMPLSNRPAHWPYRLASDPKSWQFKAPARSAVATPAPKPAAATAPKPTPTEAQLRAAAGAEYIAAFGKKDGSQWFAEGLSFDDATRRFGQKQIAANAASKTDAQRATAGVAAVFASKRSTPASNEKPDAPTSGETLPLSPGLARFAAAIKLPAK
jgi:hypothetical protein